MPFAHTSYYLTEIIILTSSPLSPIPFFAEHAGAGEGNRGVLVPLPRIRGGDHGQGL